jgi:hypothetical protein
MSNIDHSQRFRLDNIILNAPQFVPDCEQNRTSSAIPLLAQYVEGVPLRREKSLDGTNYFSEEQSRFRPEEIPCHHR